ncbi:MAG: hypothetical protein GF401_08690 [Chitinivibrionales bacterium]|nr:hypothetical protein [Chitinivibrionales bacterium]
MLRYIRLFGYFLRFSFSKAMEFRLDFFFRIVMDTIYYVINFMFFEVVFLHTDVLGGWTGNQMRVFVAGFLVVDALSMTLFSNNLWHLSTYVNRGDLDYYLIRPVSSLFFVSLRDFAANSFMNLIMAAAIGVWALNSYDGTVSFVKVLLFVIFLVNGAYLRYCVRMMTIIPVFWLHSSQGMEAVFFHLNRFIERPDRIFTGVTRIILTTICPFLLMASYPARIVLEPFNPAVPVTIIAVTLAFTFILGLLWNAGLRAYASASS